MPVRWASLCCAKRAPPCRACALPLYADARPGSNGWEKLDGVVSSQGSQGVCRRRVADTCLMVAVCVSCLRSRGDGRISGPVVLGLLPALALACVLVGNWGAGRTPVEMLQVRGGGPLLVDVEPNQPIRIVGELEPEVERQWEGLRPFELGLVGMGTMLRVKMCSSECRSLMGAAQCYTKECKEQLPDCREACKNPNWEQKLLPCWDAVRDSLSACLSHPSPARARPRWIFMCHDW